MKLTIISPETEQEHEVVWVDVETSKGNFVILKDHAPMILTIDPKKQIGFCLKNGKQEFMTCGGGCVEVGRDFVKIMLNSGPK